MADIPDIPIADADVASAAPTDLRPAMAAFHRQAFAALLAGESPRVADLAEVASRDTLDVARAVVWLEDHGQLERDGDLLVGVHGLTHRTTPHTLTIDGRATHTWCAFDAVAIPVALAATARATTTCPACQQTLTVDIDAGRLPDTTSPVLWMPTGHCEHVIDDFCAYANLFCNREHVEDWRRGAADPDGEILRLADIPPLARGAWADIAAHP
jgi:Alkylmercury lyase